MPSSTFHLRSGRKSRTVRIERVGGNLDHYYHFIMDLAWPLHHWMESHGIGLRHVRTVRAGDPRSLFFSEHFREMLGIDLSPMDGWSRLRAGLMPSKAVVLEGFNSRLRAYFRTFSGPEELRRSRDSFVAGIAARTMLPSERAAAPTIVLIEREAVASDRGASRRRIDGHAALAAMVQAYSEENGIRFLGLRLGGMRFQEQFRVLRQGPTILIGQHGAGLLNGLWMEGPGRAVVELAAEDNPAHFQHLYTDLAMPYERIVCPAEGAYGEGQTLHARAEPVLERLRMLTPTLWG